MKNLIFSFAALLGLAGLTTTSTFAQDAEQPNTYLMIDYMKVKDGQFANYETLEGIWKKIHKARIEAGMSEGWYFFGVASPRGANTEYDYVTINRFSGEEQLAAVYESPSFIPEGAEKLLNEKERAMVQKTEEFRDIVKSEVWRAVDVAFAEDFLEAKVQVFNFFSIKEGHTSAEHQKMERDIWLPVHKARVDDGAMKGWASLTMMMPYGTEQAYQDATIDVYKDMKQFMSPQNVPDYFKKVHPGKDTDTMINKIFDVAEIMRGEVRMRLDHIE